MLVDKSEFSGVSFWPIRYQEEISRYPEMSFWRKRNPWISQDITLHFYLGICRSISGHPTSQDVFFLISVQVYLRICQYQRCYPEMSLDILMQRHCSLAPWPAWKLRICSSRMIHSIKHKQAHCFRRSYSPPPPLTAPCGMSRPWRPAPQIQEKKAGWRAQCRPLPRPLHQPQQRELRQKGPLHQWWCCCFLQQRHCRRLFERLRRWTYLETWDAEAALSVVSSQKSSYCILRKQECTGWNILG